ncbi:MAG TPA: dihydropteroate synthase [Chitinophagaceae bacterium]|jgi:dihydropteroate synthase|nr:dihydropteroate synthase [Chitinophagaceae bacterium]
MFTLNCNGKLLVIDRPLVMGIINATPDSFYKASRSSNTDEILVQTEKMIAEGADIVDIGGQSTRPGSLPISADEELKRIISGIEAVHRNFPEVIISVDTYYACVAEKSIQAGASMINDISSGAMDKEMIEVVSRLKVPYIAMHIKGTPQTMQQLAGYDNVCLEVLDFFIKKKAECKKAGICDVIIDPGFGFGKTIDHNFELLKNLLVFKMLEAPIMIGVSRKSSIYKTLGISIEQALNGTTVLNTIALMNGATILRVHDVKEAKETVKLLSLVNG